MMSRGRGMKMIIGNCVIQVETEVLSCEKVVEGDKVVGALSIDAKLVGGRVLFKVLLKDTIFFPEGGGQVSVLQIQAFGF